MNDTKYLNGYEQADSDNSAARVALLEAITEARRAAAEANDKSTRGFWMQKVRRWQKNLAETRALALNRRLEAST